MKLKVKIGKYGRIGKHLCNPYIQGTTVPYDNIIIYIHARYMYTGLSQTSQRSNPGTEAVDVKGAEIDRSSLRVTCSGSSPTRGLTGMKYHTRNKTGR